MQQSVTLEQTKEGIAIVRMNLPEIKNAMTMEMTEQFQRNMDELKQNKAIRCVILTGSGGVFSAGGDVRHIAEQTGWRPEQNFMFMRGFYPVYLSVAALAVPTIAAVEGPAIGAGLALALACDMRVAAEDAKLGMTFVNIGLSPGMATTYLLPRLVGIDKANELLFTGRIINGKEAEKWGLVTRSVARELVFPTALQWAEKIASQPPMALQLAKRGLRNGLQANSIETALDFEALAQGITFSLDDIKTKLKPQM